MNILYLSPVSRCWIRQRPHSLVDELVSLGCHITWFYCGSIGKCNLINKKVNNLSILELPLLPFSFKSILIEKINAYWIRLWLRRVRCDVVVITNPRMWAWLPSHLKHLPMVYDCMDIQSHFYTGKARKIMESAEQNVVHVASQIVVSANPIATFLRNRYKLSARRPIHLIENGCYLETYEPKCVPQTQLRYPAFVYVGTLSTWFDWEAVLNAARMHSGWTFYFIGPIDTKPPIFLKNLVFIGVVPHQHIYSWLLAATVLILPFKRSTLIDGVDPVKMYEYLAAKKPIVSAWWPLMDKFSVFRQVYFYHHTSEFENSLKRLLEKSSPIDDVHDFLQKNTWTKRAYQFFHLLTANNEKIGGNDD